MPFRGRAPRPAAEHDPNAEQLLLERYRLIERLGAGGFGVVWSACDELLQRDVAVKRIWLGPEGDADRAAREAHASARLSHPAIVSLYEAHKLGEAFYLISELVEGDTLATLIAEQALPDVQILEIGLALIDALEHAHSRGVIHRDIKPQNVLVPIRPVLSKGRERPVAAKLTDFGGASLLDEDALTRTGDVLGTLAYMAPEQSEGREVAEEADLYSLALVLYEALSGLNPVRGSTPAETAKRIGSRLEPLARHRRDLPRALTRALDAALAPSPRMRGTLEDLRGDLEDALVEGLAEPRRRGRGRARAPRAPTPVQPHETELESSDTQTALAPRLDARHVRTHPDDRLRPVAAPAPGLPRIVWIALALAGIVWQVTLGRSGVALLLAAALLPLVAMPPERGSRHLSPRWLAAVLAPVLGLAGLAGAFPALAGQAGRWRQRLVLGALGYWWLVLAEPLLSRHLWLGSPSGTPARSAWEGSLQACASHVIGPLLTLGVLLGALLWGLASLVLPWIVRGRNAASDLVAAVVWSALVFAFAPQLDAGLTVAASHPSPRGAVLGAILGGLSAVGARALRGPV